MKNAKFTPGPWKVLHDDRGLWVGAEQPEDHTRFGIVTEVGCTALAPQASANARLIAQAPALYEALRALLAEFESRVALIKNADLEDGELDCMIDARAVLAKVEGR